ncbi:hypothetical protein LOAG_16162 [Loa loa]|uniref:Uncharacterized protein n=1 Tax=Loa loa TaxID=7209 RepID=A0A1S0TE54_LOALO|nr:hypothetical protein LOAG_16162 [Loa loa]EFO12371.1 hypothetical protein LOAG_16162 [Loa loa]
MIQAKLLILDFIELVQEKLINSIEFIRTQRSLIREKVIWHLQKQCENLSNMLKSLLEVLQSMEEMQTKDGDNMKLLTARSTTLTANVRQLLSTVPYA